jgi:Domain of unknown function (DUF4838)
VKPLVVLLLLFGVVRAAASVTLAIEGRASCPIVVDPAASEPERRAAGALAETLHEITGGDFTVVTNATAPRRSIVVGDGAAARRKFRDVPWSALGPEELVMKTRGGRLLLAGGRPRGTLYAVGRFLQEECGVRWWAPWAKTVPTRTTLKIRDLDRRERPAFEYREPYWVPAFDADWCWRNGANGQSSRLTPEWGGRVDYKGFVHTFYPLAPPEKYFAAHPDWYSEIKGRRTTEHAQLCLTNPELRDFIVAQVKQWLRESPGARIISVSQNDWHGACECAKCKALDDAEGTHAATMLTFANYVAEHIEAEFPDVAVDTLAYQYTRKPPKTIRPRPNVIVRLCSIECNFREPLDSPANASFGDDIRNWSKLCNRLYIWDYTTDFGHYLQPHPNWYELDANLRFFAANGVRGVFEQGAYQSQGSEMAEMRAWVLAQLLWNPRADGRALIKEFVEGYYGPAAAPAILEYLDLMHEASKGAKLTCFAGTETPQLRFRPLSRAEELWRRAEAAVAGSPEFLERTRLGHLAVRYAWLERWEKLRRECADAGAAWPLPESRRVVADEFRVVAQGADGRPWTRVTQLNEAGLAPAIWLEKVSQE